jgi:phage gp45-like
MKASEIKEMVANALYGVIRWTVSTATVDAKTRWVGVEGHAVDPSDPESQWYARLVQHYGFASSPPRNSELITSSISGEANNTSVVAEYAPGKGPDDLAEGDVSVFGSNDAQILRMNAQDNTTQLQTAGADIKLDSGDIILNGGTHKISRVGDHAKLVLRTTAAGPVSGITTLTIGVVSEDGLSQTVVAQFAFAGTSTIPPPGAPLDTDIRIPMIEGAEHALA